MPDATPKTEPQERRPHSAPVPPNRISHIDAGNTRFSGIEIVALALSVFWLFGTAVFFIFLRPDPGAGDTLQSFMLILAIVMPLAMIWIAAILARASRMMNEKSHQLQSSIDALRQAYIVQNQNGAAAASLASRLDEITAAQHRTEARLAAAATSREAGAVHHIASTQAEAETVAGGPRVNDQPRLALGTPTEAVEQPLGNVDFIYALNFPQTPEDQAGFAALRRALRHRTTAQAIQAAQDVLTLLSQEGIYMDDFSPEFAEPEIWRRFAEGTRGQAIAALGGIRDKAALSRTSDRMKQDPIFRDTVHHFLRVYDRTLQNFEPSASDTEIATFANTRTSRAFMLLGQVAGTFDGR